MDGDEESHLVRERRAKAERLRRDGHEPYPWEFAGRVATSAVLERARPLEKGTTESGPPIRVAGRLVAVRSHGGTSFLDLTDQAGDLQLILRPDQLGEEPYRYWLNELDPGDLIGAEGVPARSRRGEPSLEVHQLTILAKALAPPPEKYHGLKDPEDRLRRRYVDLLSSRETRTRFLARAGIVEEIRGFLRARDFVEAETPILVPVASGATAEPFRTRSNYLAGELQLRISIELHLKRLLVGGFDRVFELGRAFRNEDLDSTHSPEFSELEVYWAYSDYTDMRHLVEALYERLAARTAELLPDLPEPREAVKAFHPPFATVDWVSALEEHSGIREVTRRTHDELWRLVRAANIVAAEGSTTAKLLDKLFEHYVEPTLVRPTVVVDFPTITSPLAKRHRSKGDRIERFEVYYHGFELGNAYTELNDPDEQERRFREQLSERAEDAYAYDSDFVEALRFGMPPASGFGVGVDRLMMAFAGLPSIKDVILFPMVRERNPRVE
jgi:lysyl-tRNA synthetase class 2